MSGAKQDPAANIYFPAFDWLRLILAMAVALAHDGVLPDGRAANFAVQVFFALSGWLIGGILIDSERKNLPRFYFNRAMRIWAPYYFAVALVFAVSLLKEPLDFNWLEYLFYDLTYTHNWFISTRILEIQNDLPLQGTTNHFWSLSVEEQFYLFAPLIILFVRFGPAPVLWAAIAVLAVAFQTFYGAIALGVAAVSVQRRYGDWHLRPAAVAVLGLGLIVLIAGYVKAPEFYNFMAPAAAVFIVLLLARPGPKHQLGVFAGGISYPLYLNHWIGIFVSHEIVQRFEFVERGAGVVAGAIINIAAASVLYLLIDEQVRKRRSRMYTDSRGRAAAIIAYGLIVIGAAGGLTLMIARQ
ncbi:acyltransferase family protein [Hyphococcus sp.]|uniref:acyltransferase family protein n=1 Tax=Hyphococcus sp. TaxID=2038636 RepID=UPI003CCC3626